MTSWWYKITCFTSPQWLHSLGLPWRLKWLKYFVASLANAAMYHFDSERDASLTLSFDSRRQRHCFIPGKCVWMFVTYCINGEQLLYILCVIDFTLQWCAISFYSRYLNEHWLLSINDFSTFICFSACAKNLKKPSITTVYKMWQCHTGLYSSYQVG